MRYLVAALTFLALFLIPVSPTYACSGSLPTIQTLTAGAEVIVVGTLSDPTNDVITVNVEAYHKGNLRTPTLRLNNHKFGNNDDCSIIMGTGGRFPAGSRVLLFLQRDEFKLGADWRPTGVAAMDVLTILNDQLFYIDLPMGSLKDAIIQIATLTGPAHAPDQPTSLEERCFAETKVCISGSFRRFWEQNGGLTVFGFPTTPARDEPTPDTGHIYLTQWFERARFEAHPENRPPYDVLLGRLGNDGLRQFGIDWHLLPGTNGPIPATCLAFKETGNAVCDEPTGAQFKTYWLTHGLVDPQLTRYQRSLALFGLPLTLPREETNAAGERVLTQWFERARFEYHPDKPAAYRILLGLVGNEVRQGPEDAWARARRLLPQDVTLIQPATLPVRFGKPQLLEARVDGQSGPVYTILYQAPEQAENVVFILGTGAGAFGNAAPPDASAPVMVRGVDGLLATSSTDSPRFSVSWQEGSRSYEIKAYSGRITRDEFLGIVQSLQTFTPSSASLNPGNSRRS